MWKILPYHIYIFQFFPKTGNSYIKNFFFIRLAKLIVDRPNCVNCQSKIFIFIMIYRIYKFSIGGLKSCEISITHNNLVWVRLIDVKFSNGRNLSKSLRNDEKKRTVHNRKKMHRLLFYMHWHQQYIEVFLASVYWIWIKYFLCLLGEIKISIILQLLHKELTFLFIIK